MRFLSLEIENFCSIGNASIDLSCHGPVLIVGDNRDRDRSNGAGKSSIFEALTWCVFGHTNKLGDAHSMIGRDISGKCRVRVVIEDGGKRYEVERSRISKKVDIIFNDITGDKKDLRCKDVKETTAAIEHLLGVSFREFTRSNYIPQREPTPFGSMTDKELKNFFINDLLDIQWIQNAYERVKCDAENVMSQLNDVSSDIVTTKVKVQESTIRIEDLSERGTHWQDRHSGALGKNKEELLAALDVVDAMKREEENIALEKLDIKRELEQIEVAIDVLDRLKQLDREKREIERWLRDYVIQHERPYERALEKLQELQANASNNICPTCGADITESLLPKMIDDANTEVFQLSGALTGMKTEVNAKRDRLMEIERDIDEINRDVSGLEDKESRRHDLAQRLFHIQWWDGLERAKAAVVKLNEERAKISAEENPYIDLINNEIEKIQVMNKELAALQDSKKLLERRYKDLEFWIHGFSPAGIQSYLLDSITPVLNDRLRNVLYELTGGELEARFNTVKQLKSGEYREYFNLEVANVLGGGSYGQLSGGEAKRVDLATSIVMADMIRGRSNKQLDLLVFDEPFRSLDQDGIDSFMRYVGKAYSGLPLFVISHTDVDPTLFRREWKVIKENGVSRLEV